MNLEEAVLSTFLFYGYLPKMRNDLWDQPWAQYAADPGIRDAYLKSSISEKEEDLVSRGASIFRRMFSDVPKGTHIVPLSGGLDSRAILAGLLDAGLHSEIIAVTYGTPGSLDYEIPALLCKKSGVRHERIDLTETELPREFGEISADSGQWFFFDAAYRTLITRKYGEDAIYWSGFMGGELAGTHCLPVPSQSWDAACTEFARHNRFVQSVNFCHPDFQPEAALPSQPIFEGGLLKYDDQLDFAIRQMSYVKPVVMQERYNWQAPLLDSEWVYFILSVPHRYRLKEGLYSKILKTCYPKLFSLPTKNGGGLSVGLPEWLIRLQKRFIYKGARTCATILASVASGELITFRNNRPMVNYIDFDETLRMRKDVREFIFSCLMDLKDRRAASWLDVDLVWNQQMKGLNYHGDALFLLAALELNLKRSQSKLPEMNFRSTAFKKFVN
jgi:hypothetical protein